MTTATIKATKPQAAFHNLQCKYPAFVGGFGTGKSETMANQAVIDACIGGSGSLIALYEPTFDLVKLIMLPRIEQKLDQLGISYKTNKSDFTITTSTGGVGDFILRAMQNPERIVGYESFRSHIDELDTLKTDHAREVWTKVIARNRQRPKGCGDINRCSVYTTPEGFRFVYDRWCRNASDEYRMIQAATASNPFLPADYVESLRATYPANLIDAYLNGEFVNLSSGVIYHCYDDKLNASCETVTDKDRTLLVGMDFNVTKMSAKILVTRGDTLHCVDELYDLYDTQDMIEHLKARYPDKKLIVYPDASGKNRKSCGADITDISLLKAAGFRIKAHDANPRVRSRINAVNAMLCNAKGERRLFINALTCPKTSEDLKQQVYDKHGEPDKSTGNDHGNDALGYPIAYEFPIESRAKSLNIYG